MFVNRDNVVKYVNNSQMHIYLSNTTVTIRWCTTSNLDNQNFNLILIPIIKSFSWLYIPQIIWEYGRQNIQIDLSLIILYIPLFCTSLTIMYILLTYIWSFKYYTIKSHILPLIFVVGPIPDWFLIFLNLVKFAFLY